FLPVRVLSRLYRRLFLEMVIAAHKADRLQFINGDAALADFKTFAAWISALRQVEWVTYAKRPFGGPEPVLAYLSRYTHWWPGLAGPLLWLAALIFTSVGRFS